MILRNTSNVLVNPGNVYAEPIITVYGTGDITLIVNDTFVELEGIEDDIVFNQRRAGSLSG